MIALWQAAHAPRVVRLRCGVVPLLSRDPLRSRARGGDDSDEVSDGRRVPVLVPVRCRPPMPYWMAGSTGESRLSITGSVGSRFDDCENLESSKGWLLRLRSHRLPFKPPASDRERLTADRSSSPQDVLLETSL